MSLITQVSAPVNGAAVFNPMIFEFAWEEAGCEVVNENGIMALRVSIAYESLLPVGSSLRITNGTLSGVYVVTASAPLLGGTLILLTLNVPFTGNSNQTGSNEFIPNVAAEFQLISGYQAGPEALIKPWSITSEIRVSPGTNGVYRFDVSGFLKARYRIEAPDPGPAVPVSLRYLVRLKSSAALPSDAGALAAYYGLETLTQAQLAAEEPVGDRPVLFFGGAPTLYSLVGSKGIINNFIADPNAGTVTTSGEIVDLQLLSCEPKEVTWVGVGPTTGFTVTPALPSWIQATADGNNIELIINPCTLGIGDYLAEDYNPADYLVSGQLNSITGCFSFDFTLGGNQLFTLGVCVSPVAELVNVCAEDTLNFAWLNSLGGYSSLAVEGRFIEGRTFGDQKTVITASRVLKRVEIRDVYKTIEIRGGVISKPQLDLLADLRSSIQAYLYNTETSAYDIPIVIESESFTTYGNRFNQAETKFAFRFRNAQQIRVQTQ